MIDEQMRSVGLVRRIRDYSLGLQKRGFIQLERYLECSRDTIVITCFDFDKSNRLSSIKVALSSFRLRMLLTIVDALRRRVYSTTTPHQNTTLTSSCRDIMTGIAN